MTQFEVAELISNTIHHILSQSTLKHTRFLYTSAVLLDLLKRQGIECKLWQGTTHWYSKKYVELHNQGYDFSLKAYDSSDEKRFKKKAEALRKKGVLSVSCIANANRTSEELGGHVAILAKLDERYYLIDPTAFQFKRTQTQHHAIIDAPNIAFFELFRPEYAFPDSFIFMQENMGAYYQYQELDSLAKLQSHPNIEKTDFNPFKYKELYDNISELINKKLSKE